MIRQHSRKWDPHMARIILSLAWPTMLKQLMQTAVQYIDRHGRFTGHYLHTDNAHGSGVRMGMYDTA